jgi:hypothetical protein
MQVKAFHVIDEKKMQFFHFTPIGNRPNDE